MRILVCGDRKWNDFRMIRDALSEFDSRTTLVIHGAARGADTLGGLAALALGMRVESYPALWDKYGRKAGPIRNQQMLVEGRPSLVFAFHDDLDASRGTKDMVKRASRAGVRCRVYSHGMPTTWFSGFMTNDEVVQITANLYDVLRNYCDDDSELDNLVDAVLTKAIFPVIQTDVELVRSMRTAHYSWEQVGEALGVSKQAAWERYHVRVRHG